MTARHAAVPAPVGLPDRPTAPGPPAPQAPRTAPLPTSPPLHIQPDRRESDLRRDGNRQKLTHSECDEIGGAGGFGAERGLELDQRRRIPAHGRLLHPVQTMNELTPWSALRHLHLVSPDTGA